MDMLVQGLQEGNPEPDPGRSVRSELVSRPACSTAWEWVMLAGLGTLHVPWVRALKRRIPNVCRFETSGICRGLWKFLSCVP